MRRTSTTKIKSWNDKKTLARWVIVGYLTIFGSPLVSAAVVSDLFGTWDGTWFVDEIYDELSPTPPIAFEVDAQFNIVPFTGSNYGTILLDTTTPGVISSITVVGDNVEMLIDYPATNYEAYGVVTGILTGNTIVGDFDEVPTEGWVTGKGALVISKIVSSVDSDSDGIVDLEDNCIEAPNGLVSPDAGSNSQLDTDEDGIGNMCDGDLNNDGSTNTLDLNLYKLAHRTSPGDANYNPDADFNGDVVINTLDLNIYKGLHRKDPGPSCCGAF